MFEIKETNKPNEMILLIYEDEQKRRSTGFTLTKAQLYDLFLLLKKHFITG